MARDGLSACDQLVCVGVCPAGQKIYSFRRGFDNMSFCLTSQIEMIQYTLDPTYHSWWCLLPSIIFLNASLHLPVNVRVSAGGQTGRNSHRILFSFSTSFSDACLEGLGNISRRIFRLFRIVTLDRKSTQQSNRRSIIPIGKKRWARKSPFGLTQGVGRCILFTAMLTGLPPHFYSALSNHEKCSSRLKSSQNSFFG